MEKKVGKRMLIGFVLFWFAILIIVPIYGIFRETLKSDFSRIITAITSPAALHAFQLTFIITMVVVTVNGVFGILMAYVFARQHFRGKIVLESLLDLPFAVSPVVIGLMLILLFSPYRWFGNFLSTIKIQVLYALPGMIIATLFVTLPFMAKEIIPVLRELGIEQEEAAHVLGASKWQTFTRVMLPPIKRGILYGMTLTIARAIGEFGAVLVVSGSIVNKTQTATILIHDQFTDLDYTGAFSTANILIITSLIVISLLHFLGLKRNRAK